MRNIEIKSDNNLWLVYIDNYPYYTMDQELVCQNVYNNSKLDKLFWGNASRDGVLKTVNQYINKMKTEGSKLFDFNKKEEINLQNKLMRTWCKYFQIN